MHNIERSIPAVGSSANRSQFMKWIGVTLLAMAILWVWLIGSGVQLGHTGDPTTADASRSVGNVEVEGHHRTANRIDRLVRKQDGASAAAWLDDAYSAIRTQGDYGALWKVMKGKLPNERFALMYGEFMGLRSRLGSGHDFHAKLAVINEFGGDRTADFTNKLLKATGRNLDIVGDKDFITSLDHESWKAMVSGAAERNASKAFELAMENLGDSHGRIACAEAVRVWLGQDPMAASKRVSEMQNGPLKDVAICELVGWVMKKDGPKAAEAWIGEIDDPRLRKQFSKQSNEAQ